MKISGLLLALLILLPAGAPPVTAASMSVTFSPGQVPGGSSSTGTLAINEAAPDGGLAVSLSSSTPAAIVPQRVVIPAGSTEATFPVKAAWIAAPTRVQIVATAVGRIYLSGMGTLTLLPSGVTGLLFDPPNVVGGAPSVGTVLLSAPAPEGGIEVKLAVEESSSPSPQCSPPPAIPATVKVAGGAHRATFPIKTSPSWEESFDIQASYSATSVSGTLRVTKPWLRELKVPERVRGGTTVPVVVVLAGPALPPNCGIKYRLASSDPATAQVPADIVFPGGAREVTLEMKTGKVPTPHGVTLTVTGFYFYTADAYAESKETRIALTPW
jgi:hypothetical protein